ncbi:RNA polymerase sporulation sigma factor SigK [Alkalibaculum sp. M08DMB]|uniref:RNA polymerase sigma factor n=1 Tax=Alkalibaculum sporogenes TaxID=2655001 RepID=A0A6A7KBC9_9FIRM|nr:RNA polymerase sporulation sigma factor SigK [Alkalibaculum sporogenes]
MFFVLGTSLLGIAALLKNIYFLLGYLTGNSFPNPLSREDEQKYLNLYKNGDQKAKNILIEHNLRLVAHIVKKYSYSSLDTEDLISIGTIGLIKAISTFKADKGTKLATYASKCIDNEILMFIRSEQKTRNDVSLYDPIGIDKEGNKISLMDILGTEGDTVYDNVLLKIQAGRLQQLMDKVLHIREKEIIILRYGLDNHDRRTQKQIADDMGISRSYVSRIEKKAVQKLAQEFSKKYVER